MTPFNALVVTVTTTNPDPLGPTVVDLAAVGARIDPASRHDPVLDFVFETRVDPGRAIPAVLTAFCGIDPEDLKSQPRLPEAIDLLRAQADLFRPDVLATCHPPDVADVLPHLARQLMPRDPHWVSTFRLNCHVSPFDLNWIEQGASCDAGRKVEARGLDPHRPARPNDHARPPPGPASARARRSRLRRHARHAPRLVGGRAAPRARARRRRVPRLPLEAGAAALLRTHRRDASRRRPQQLPASAGGGGRGDSRGRAAGRVRGRTGRRQAAGRGRVERRRRAVGHAPGEPGSPAVAPRRSRPRSRTRGGGPCGRPAAARATQRQQQPQTKRWKEGQKPHFPGCLAAPSRFRQGHPRMPSPAHPPPVRARRPLPRAPPDHFSRSLSFNPFLPRGPPGFAIAPAAAVRPGINPTGLLLSCPTFTLSPSTSRPPVSTPPRTPSSNSPPSASASIPSPASTMRWGHSSPAWSIRTATSPLPPRPSTTSRPATCRGQPRPRPGPRRPAGGGTRLPARRAGRAQRPLRCRVPARHRQRAHSGRSPVGLHLPPGAPPLAPSRRLRPPGAALRLRPPGPPRRPRRPPGSLRCRVLRPPAVRGMPRPDRGRPRGHAGAASRLERDRAAAGTGAVWETQRPVLARGAPGLPEVAPEQTPLRDPFAAEIVAAAEAALRGVYAVPPEQPGPCARRRPAASSAPRGRRPENHRLAAAGGVPPPSYPSNADRATRGA